MKEVKKLLEKIEQTPNKIIEEAIDNLSKKMNKEEIEINIEELMQDINEQIWRFEQKYHKRPLFLKVGVYTYTVLEKLSKTYFKYLDTEKEYLHTFMGLLVCETPTIEDLSVEVF